MRSLAAIIILLPVFAYFVFSRRKSDPLNPYNAYTLLYILKIVVPTLIYSSAENVSIADDYFLEGALYNDAVFLKYTVLQSIGYCCVLFGLRVALGNRVYELSGNTQANNLLSKQYKLWGYILYGLGFLGFLLIMSKVGGIVYFFSNLNLRTYMVRDLDFESYLLSLLNYAPLLIVYSKKWSHEKIGTLDIVLIAFAGLMVGLGGRKALMMLAIESAVVYHYVVKPINVKRLLSVKTIALILMVFVFFTTFSKLRTPGAVDDFLDDPVEFYLGNNEGGLQHTLAGESYVPFYVSIVNYFDKNKKWNGASFASLPSAFIPSSFYPQKPPVDDGMYLYSIAHGTHVSPPMPTKSLDGTSWPLETFGAMYANFGELGVPIGMILLGLIIGYFFKRMVYQNFPFKLVIFYTFILFTFELSTLRIVQSIITFVILSLVQFIISRNHV